MLKIKRVDQETIKNSNKKMIINLILNKRELTKQQIAKDIGVSIPTVINNINELIQEGLVEEAGVTNSSGGRKPKIVKFIPDSRFSFGISIDLHRIRIILTNLDSQILHETFLTIDPLSELKDIKDINILFDKICDSILDIISLKGIERSIVLGVGISLPGTVNEEKLVLEWAPNLSIRNIEFETMAHKLKLPVFVENEANAAAVAELRLGVAKDMRNLVFISITEGIGTGIVIQDYIYKGKNKRAGEFGHMTIVKDGKQCKCGRNGCWEQYSSESALIDEYNKKTEEKVKNLEEFFTILEDGVFLAEKVWDNYLEYLAIGIQNIILILDPHYIVLGGRISNYEDFIIERLKEKVFTKNSFFSGQDMKIFASKLKENSSIIGAALLPLHSLFF